MKANEIHISLETAKLLKDCGVESEYQFIFENTSIYQDKGEPTWIVIHNKNHIPLYPAYTWQEIEDNAELFFDNTRNYCRGDHQISKPKDCYNCCYQYEIDIEEIKKLRLQKKYEEADEYFRKNSILTN